MCGESKSDLPSGAFIPNSLAYTVCANGSVFGHLGIDQAILVPQHCPCYTTFKGSWTLYLFPGWSLCGWGFSKPRAGPLCPWPSISGLHAVAGLALVIPQQVSESYHDFQSFVKLSVG